MLKQIVVGVWRRTVLNSVQEEGRLQQYIDQCINSLFSYDRLMVSHLSMIILFSRAMFIVTCNGWRLALLNKIYM